jgi:hypothetical protein
VPLDSFNVGMENQADYIVKWTRLRRRCSMLLKSQPNARAKINVSYIEIEDIALVKARRPCLDAMAVYDQLKKNYWQRIEIKFHRFIDPHIEVTPRSL